MDPETINRFGQPRPDELLIQAAAAETAAAAAEVAAPGQATAAAADREAAAAEIAAMDAADLEFARSQYKTPPPPPGAPPYRLPLAALLGQAEVDAIEQNGKFIFHATGDTGQHGHGAAAQDSVAWHMERQVKAPASRFDKPRLFYHLGDVVYYNGELEEYPSQFYDPYINYRRPILAVPGNHDGDNISAEDSLASFVANFCTAQPQRPPKPGQSHRLTMIQPNYYFTLLAPFITLIGLYSNVTGDLDDPNGGKRTQFDWLVKELEDAPAGKFLVVAVHHPPFSADNSHGSSKRIRAVLDDAFSAARRLPHLVLAAHVHNYQRFSRDQSLPGGGEQRTIPYIVAGAGGYAGYDSLHQINEGVPPSHGARLVKSNEELPTFLVLTATAGTLRCDCYTVPLPPVHTRTDNPASLFDTVEVSL